MDRHGSVVERLWTKPSLSITGLDAPQVDGASNTLVPTARAKISLRIAPGDTTANAVECLRRHLEAHVPWGAELTFTVVDTGEATAIDATGPAYDAARQAFTEAWDGTEPVDMGVGGSIPFIAEFLEAFPEASVLVTGVEDPDTRAHGANEGLHLAEFERVVLAEALLLRQPRRQVMRRPARSSALSRAAGSVTVNVLPAPSSESTWMAPPCRSTIRLTIARPRPVPGCRTASGLVERKNSSNRRSWSAAEIPRPSSATSIRTRPPSRRQPDRDPAPVGRCTSPRC